MIKLENNMLILDPSVTKQDAKAINDFVAQVQKDERAKIISEIDKLEQISHQTRTPLYQETIFNRLREALK